MNIRRTRVDHQGGAHRPTVPPSLLSHVSHLKSIYSEERGSDGFTYHEVSEYLDALESHLSEILELLKSGDDSTSKILREVTEVLDSPYAGIFGD